MIPNPIRKVLSTLSTHEVRYLLMGGQACVLYGAAEFSRDCDIVILCDGENIDRLNSALLELDAILIAVPPFETKYLDRGHAVHFRCRAAEVAGIRIDVMSKMRNAAPFEQLWSRRTTLADDAGSQIELMALEDLITAKKTQRDKDWPMLRRLVESHFATHRATGSDKYIQFWLSEARTPELLIQIAARYPEAALQIVARRPLVDAAIKADHQGLEVGLAEEELRERRADRDYWQPLKRELEQLRSSRRA